MIIKNELSALPLDILGKEIFTYCTTEEIFSKVSFVCKEFFETTSKEWFFEVLLKRDFSIESREAKYQKCLKGGMFKEAFCNIFYDRKFFKVIFKFLKNAKAKIVDEKNLIVGELFRKKMELELIEVEDRISEKIREMNGEWKSLKKQYKLGSKKYSKNLKDFSSKDIKKILRTKIKLILREPKDKLLGDIQIRLIDFRNFFENKKLEKEKSFGKIGYYFEKIKNFEGEKFSNSNLFGKVGCIVNFSKKAFKASMGNSIEKEHFLSKFYRKNFVNLEKFYKVPFEKRITLVERERFEGSFSLNRDGSDYEKKLNKEYKKYFGMSVEELVKANCMEPKSSKKYQNLVYSTFIKEKTFKISLKTLN
jgi:hypothetical protein